MKSDDLPVTHKPHRLSKFLAQPPPIDKATRALVRCQPGAANQVYPLSYRFFEKKRIAENKPKSGPRKTNETVTDGQGFELQHDDGKRWVFTGFRG